DLWAWPSGVKLNRTASCVVMGLGSSAMAKLIGANSGATMYAALKQLPWGFSSTSGGATELAAWEVLVWGSSTYCSFVVTSPTYAPSAAAAGCATAAFRGPAPRKKTIQIAQIGHPKPPGYPKSYRGMRGGGAKLLAGTIGEKTYRGGELAFITATTNN